MNAEVAVSVVVSTHNRAHYLRDGLTTLAAQQCEARYEVIVIDNGSTDTTSAVLNEWCRSDSRFRTASEPRLGLSYGKNAGIRLARAPLLLFTDDDTLVDPHWIQSYLDLFARHEGELIAAGGTQVPVPHDLHSWPEWFDEAAMAELGLLNYGEERPLASAEYVWGANMAVPRRVFENCGLWKETIGRQGAQRGTFEDTEFQDRVRAAGGSVWFVPDAIIKHRIERFKITPRRISSSAFARGRNDFWKETIPVWRDPALVPKQNVASVLRRLTTHLVLWTCWAIAFRWRRTKRSFESARRSAFHSGRTLDSLRAGRQSQRLYLAIGRLAFGIRHLLLRITPDAA